MDRARDELANKIRAALEQFTAGLTNELPAHFGLMALFYNLGTSPCDVSMVSNHDEPGEVLRILNATARRLLNRYGGPTRVFALPSRSERVPFMLRIATRYSADAVNTNANAMPRRIVVRAVMQPVGAREFLVLYDAEFDAVGEMTLNRGDSAHVAALLGLVDETA